MKKVLSLAVCAFAAVTFAQVGVDTDAPTRKLDVNGDLRVRTTENVSEMTDADEQTDYNRVLVASDGTTTADNEGNVDYIPLSEFSRAKVLAGSITGNGTYPETLEAGNLKLGFRIAANQINVHAGTISGTDDCNFKGRRYIGADFSWAGDLSTYVGTGTNDEVYEFNYDVDHGGNMMIQCMSGKAYHVRFISYRPTITSTPKFTVVLQELN